jgi:nucleoporin NUP159
VGKESYILRSVLTIAVMGLYWLKNQELLLVHNPNPSANLEDPDNKYHIVSYDKGMTEFTFHPTTWDPLLVAPQGPSRPLPARFSAVRLQNWEPDLDDMLIVTTSHTDTIAVLTHSSKPLSSTQPPEMCEKWTVTRPEDTRQAAVPLRVFGEDGDSVFIGEALDLSATEKIARPVRMLEEIDEAPWPLPAYMALTHQGVLIAWWIVWDRSVEDRTRYPSLIAGNGEKPEASEAPTPANGQMSTPMKPLPTSGTGSTFAKAAATFGGTSIPQFGATGLGSTPPFIPKTSQPFGSTTPAPTNTATASFGSPSILGAPKTAAPFGSTTPAATKPAAPSFGSPSVMGAPKASGFGAVGGIGNKPSPWGTPSQAQSNPFSAASGNASGFAKFGQPGGGSTFSSFGSNGGSQSGFASLGQKSAFPGLKTEPSAGSTITIGSGTGSSLPSWANTPAQQGSSIFGQPKASFNTSSFESKDSDSGDAENRKRDESTPTPQVPSQSANGLFGLAGGFKLGSTFEGDGSAHDDPAKPTAPSTGGFFGSDFASGLGGPSYDQLKAPTTPAKDATKDAPKDLSTTPASPPRQQKQLFPGATPTKESATPKVPPPVEQTPKTDEAPLPPDFLTFKPTQPIDDELPPIAGSPGIKVEAPSSSVEASPIDEEDGDHEGDYSAEEEYEDESDEVEEVEETLPSDTIRKVQGPRNGGFSFQDSVNQSPRVFPPAPTPPAAKPGATSTSVRSTSPAQPALFGQPSKPQTTASLFGSQPQKGSFSLSSTAAKPHFPAPTSRTQDSFRSPSPVRPASSLARGPRREPIAAPGSSLSASVQQSRSLTPQPLATDLEDEEAERMHEQLSRPIEPSRILDEFVAYQNYTGSSPSKTGHAAQIEMIYKDINGMIDALGWNARSVQSFTRYHKQSQSSHKVDQQTLEDIEDEGEDGSWFEQWTLGEMGALKAVEDELEHELDSGRVQNVLDKLSQLARLLREKAKLMTRLNDIRRQILTRKDPEKAESLRKAPLSKEDADTQKTLRNEYARLLTLLSQAEQASIVLRSRLAAHNARHGTAGAMPTVEAVRNTMMKISRLAEERNSKITLLESQMRKINLTDSSRPSSSASRSVGTPRRSRGASMRNSIADTPFTTPPTNRTKMSLSELNRRALTPEVDDTPTSSKGYGLTYAPGDGSTPGTELVRMSDLVDDNIDSLRETARRRKQVATGLKKALIARGIKTTKLR